MYMLKKKQKHTNDKKALKHRPSAYGLLNTAEYYNKV